MTWMFKWWWGMTVRGMTVLLLALPAGATHSESLRWRLPAGPEATGFNVFWHYGDGTFMSNLGMVEQTQDGVFFTSLPNMPDDTDIFIHLTAYNAEGESPPSNTICRENNAICVPMPWELPPPPEVDPTSAALEGFALWNATTDKLVMGNFVSGQSFDPGCWAIQIKGNKYLNSGNGSVKKYLDGVPHTANNSCEQKAPFAWEDGDTMSKWACADTLTLGEHKLVVEAYNNKTCSGTPVDILAVEFGVGVVPEPDSHVMLAVGVGVLIYLSRKRARAV